MTPIRTATLRVCALLLVIALPPGCSGDGSAGVETAPAAQTTPVDLPTAPAAGAAPLNGMLTYHNDNARTGQNTLETVLNPANVNVASFGKLFSVAVDGMVYAQPLYVAKVNVAGQPHNLVLVATEHNSVYAFDADRAGAPLWQTSFIDPANGVTTQPSTDTGCPDVSPEIGITSTPVIDPVTGSVFVVAKTKESGVARYRLHALDISTGADRSGGGVDIQASVAGSGGRVVFDARIENQRLALLLSGGVVYFGTGSYCDLGGHHGWMLGYDAATLAQRAVLNVTPHGTEGGIWQSGGGAAADSAGQIYVATGNGSFDPAAAVGNYGNSILKLGAGSLGVLDYFTPYNQQVLSDSDGDLGSAGVLVLPDQPVGPPHLLLGAGKQGIVYLLDRDHLGKFQASGDGQIVQSLAGGVCGAGACPVFGTPAYFGQTVYLAPVADKLRAFSLVGGKLVLSAGSANTFGWPGATPVVSANGSSNGVVWALETNGSGAAAVLHAYPANNVGLELYNSTQNAARDTPGGAVKFAVPTVINGKVYVGTQDQLAVFGLLR